MTNKSSMTDVQTLRKQAHQHIEEGAITSGYAADRKAVLKMLGELDPATRRMLESILAVEEAHVEELADILDDLPSRIS